MAITNFVSRCLNGKPPVINGDGTQIRDFTIIDVIVPTNHTMLDTGDVDNEARDIGSTDNIVIKTLATTIWGEIDPLLELVYINRFETDVEHTHGDVSKAR